MLPTRSRKPPTRAALAGRASPAHARSPRWLVAADGIRHRALDVGEAELRARVERLREPFVRFRHGAAALAHVAFDTKLARELYGLLLAPFRDALDDIDEILLVPDRSLHALPFEALVVLSACETADGPVRRGEGLESLSNAFLLAGADGVVATLWRIDDSAARLMEIFYRELARGVEPARALRAAKLALLRREENGAHTYALPFYWAAFVLRDGAGRG